MTDKSRPQSSSLPFSTVPYTASCHTSSLRLCSECCRNGACWLALFSSLYPFQPTWHIWGPILLFMSTFTVTFYRFAQTSLGVVICDRPWKREFDCRAQRFWCLCIFKHLSPCPTGPLSAACRLTVKDLALSNAARGFDIFGHQLAALCLSVQLLPAVWFWALGCRPQLYNYLGKATQVVVRLRESSKGCQNLAQSKNSVKMMIMILSHNSFKTRQSLFLFYRCGNWHAERCFFCQSSRSH